MVLARSNATSRLSYRGQESLFFKRKWKVLKAFFSNTKDVKNVQRSKKSTTPPLPPSRLSFYSTQTKMAAHSSRAANEKDKLPERVVLWDETEVAEKQINQVCTSACGATAVLNVLVR